MMQMVGAFAEFEREVLRDVPKTGLKAARRDGPVGRTQAEAEARTAEEVVQIVMKGRKNRRRGRQAIQGASVNRFSVTPAASALA